MKRRRCKALGTDMRPDIDEDATGPQMRVEEGTRRKLEACMLRFQPRQDVQPRILFIAGWEGEREARLAVSGFLKRRQTEKPVRSFFKLRGIR